MIEQSTRAANTGALPTGSLIYRFEAQLGEQYPVGIFPEGIRFHNGFDGTIVAGPFEGARIHGIDLFVLRPDGVGEVVAPEVIDTGEVRAQVEVRGYVVPPDDLDIPPLEAIASPGFAFPDLDLRFTGSGLMRSAAPGLEWMARTIAVLEGTVNLGTGRIKVEARAA